MATHRIGKTVGGQVAVNCDSCGKALYTGDEYVFSSRPACEADFPYCTCPSAVAHIILCAKCAEVPTITDPRD